MRVDVALIDENKKMIEDMQQGAQNNANTSDYGAYYEELRLPICFH